MQLAVILPQRCLGKARVEPVNADISLGVFMAHSHVFHTRAVFDRVAHVLQFRDKAIKAVGGSNSLFHIFAYHTTNGRLAGLPAQPFVIRFSLAVRFDDGQPILSAKFIRYLSDSVVVGVKVVAEHFSVRIGYRIDDYMIVQVAFVQMGADRTLKPIRKKPLCKFTANLVYLVGRGFTGAETLYDVVGQNSLIRGLLPQSFG